MEGRWWSSGQVVILLTFYFSVLSLNLAKAYSFSVKFVIEKNKNKKEAGDGPFNIKLFSSR